MATNQRILKVAIECVQLPPANWGGHTEIWMGIQADKEVVQRIKLPGNDVVFTAELRVGNEESEPTPNFLGPYAHGTAKERFMYICWGKPGFGGWSGFRRAKLPLAGLNWNEISTNEVRARLQCTDAKGGPICATVKPDKFSWLV